MENSIRVGIVGYGNLGKGVEIAIHRNPDLKLVGVFTRRDPSTIQTVFPGVEVFTYDEMEKFTDKIDVMVLCGGSASDLPTMSPEIVAKFNIVDSFDNHSKIPAHIEKVDRVAKESGKVGVVSVGWDPGLFSMNRLLGEIVLPTGGTHTFWGEGLSQGHSEAVRRIEGVKAGVQYTVPIDLILEKARAGEGAELTGADRHKRVCYVVADEKDQTRIENEIKTMPDYFAPYDTTVHFISEEELKQNHSKMKHGGFVIRSGNTSDDNQATVEFALALDSNPEFTASVLVAYARAAYHLNKRGETGAKTAFDIPLSVMTNKSSAEIYKDLL
ncbi:MULTISPECIES: diaminopimelate dehydrogenase [unclassified Virgibacillus]|uniref:diaminopimelate dehydrogenase n=1 Tax=unclassified Virgibacillus TaxID=2620237 RepID=UPI0024DED384|nr:diaminopimelate dehydrogenase [Virgibacillus sp. LDC-1]